MKKLLLIVVLAFALLTPLLVQTASANPDPVEVSWHVTDTGGNSINGAKLTIYWATSTSGPFTVFPAQDALGNYIIDKINGVTTDPPGPPKMSGPKQNPIISGYWNPTYTAGMTICDLHPKGGLSGLYFYVKIEAGSDVWYWPVAASTKPGDSSWAPVAASTPSGYAAAGPGIGTGPTTAYPTRPPPHNGVPEFAIDTPVLVSLMAMLFFAIVFKRKKLLQK